MFNAARKQWGNGPGTKVPHGDGLGTASGAAKYQQECEPFLGPPPGDIPLGPRDMPREMWGLADAYLNTNLEYVSNTVIKILSQQNSFMTNRVLPLKRQENPKITWTMIKFDRSLAEFEPELGVPRLATLRKEQRGGMMCRHGLGMEVNHGFAATEGGADDWSLKLQSIVGMIQETMDQAGLMALVQAPNFYATALLRRISSYPTVLGAYAESTRLFGAMQFRKRYWHEMHTLGQQLMSLENVEPDTWIVPVGVQSWASISDDHEVNADKAGEITARYNINNGYKAFTTFRGCTVHGARPVHLDLDGRTIEPLSRNRTIGKYAVLPYYRLQEIVPGSAMAPVHAAGRMQMFIPAEDDWHTFTWEDVYHTSRVAGNPGVLNSVLGHPLHGTAGHMVCSSSGHTGMGGIGISQGAIGGVTRDSAPLPLLHVDTSLEDVEFINKLVGDSRRVPAFISRAMDMAIERHANVDVEDSTAAAATWASDYSKKHRCSDHKAMRHKKALMDNFLLNTLKSTDELTDEVISDLQVDHNGVPRSVDEVALHLVNAYLVHNDKPTALYRQATRCSGAQEDIDRVVPFLHGNVLQIAKKTTESLQEPTLTNYMATAEANVHREIDRCAAGHTDEVELLKRLFDYASKKHAEDQSTLRIAHYMHKLVLPLETDADMAAFLTKADAMIVDTTLSEEEREAAGGVKAYVEERQAKPTEKERETLWIDRMTSVEDDRRGAVATAAFHNMVVELCSNLENQITGLGQSQVLGVDYHVLRLYENFLPDNFTAHDVRTYSTRRSQAQGFNRTTDLMAQLYFVMIAKITSAVRGKLNLDQNKQMIEQEVSQYASDNQYSPVETAVAMQYAQNLLNYCGMAQNKVNAGTLSADEKRAEMAHFRFSGHLYKQAIHLAKEIMDGQAAHQQQQGQGQKQGQKPKEPRKPQDPTRFLNLDKFGEHFKQYHTMIDQHLNDIRSALGARGGSPSIPARAPREHEKNPFDFLLVRPTEEYIMGSAILCKAGDQLGNTFYGHEDFMMSDDAQAKKHFGHLTLLHASLIKDESQMFIFHDVFCQRYVGGGGAEILPWDYTKELKNSIYDTFRHHHCSILAIPIPIGGVDIEDNTLATRNPIDLSGRIEDLFAEYLGENCNGRVDIGDYAEHSQRTFERMNMRYQHLEPRLKHMILPPVVPNYGQMFPGQNIGRSWSDRIAATFGFKNANSEAAAAAAGTNFHKSTMVQNTLVHAAGHRFYDDKTNRWHETQSNTGHFGEANDCRGTLALRNGNYGLATQIKADFAAQGILR